MIKVNAYAKASDEGTSVFQVEIDQHGQSAFTNGLHFYIEASGLDFQLLKFSKASPQVTIKVLCLARIKAIYRGGSREIVRDMKSFYSNLTDEEYKATQFMCNHTHEMV